MALRSCGDSRIDEATNDNTTVRHGIIPDKVPDHPCSDGPLRQATLPHGSKYREKPLVGSDDGPQIVYVIHMLTSVPLARMRACPARRETVQVNRGWASAHGTVRTRRTPRVGTPQPQPLEPYHCGFFSILEWAFTGPLSLPSPLADKCLTYCPRDRESRHRSPRHRTTARSRRQQQRWPHWWSRHWRP